MSNTTRPSISESLKTFEDSVKGKIFYCPQTKNKGGEGQFLENLLGIPTSSACLDCADGEIKAFPLKKLKDGNFSPKETIAITTRGLQHDKEPLFSKLINPDVSWEDSALKKKTNSLLLISYFREGHNITFLHSYLFDSESPEYKQFKLDYNIIMNYYKTNGICQINTGEEGHLSNTVNGTYIQGRTKGQGGKNKTVGFYFKSTEFVKKVILNN